MKIKKAIISKMPESFFDPMPSVSVVYEDDTSEELFEYFPDEISFTPEEFIGLTAREALDLKMKKDREYLRC